MNTVDWTTVAVSAAAAATVGTVIALTVVALYRRREQARTWCAAGDHKFAPPPGYYTSPIVYCRRPGCRMEGVSAMVAPSIAVELHNAIPPEHRWPPVHLDHAGNAYPLEGIDDRGMATASTPPEAAPDTGATEVPVGTVYAQGPDGAWAEAAEPETLRRRWWRR